MQREWVIDGNWITRPLWYSLQLDDGGRRHIFEQILKVLCKGNAWCSSCCHSHSTRAKPLSQVGTNVSDLHSRFVLVIALVSVQRGIERWVLSIWVFRSIEVYYREAVVGLDDEAADLPCIVLGSIHQLNIDVTSLPNEEARALIFSLFSPINKPESRAEMQ